jgi:hypothetical protein
MQSTQETLQQVQSLCRIAHRRILRLDYDLAFCSLDEVSEETLKDYKSIGSIVSYHNHCSAEDDDWCHAIIREAKQWLIDLCVKEPGINAVRTVIVTDEPGHVIVTKTVYTMTLSQRLQHCIKGLDQLKEGKEIEEWLTTCVSMFPAGYPKVWDDVLKEAQFQKEQTAQEYVRTNVLAHVKLHTRVFTNRSCYCQLQNKEDIPEDLLRRSDGIILHRPTGAWNVKDVGDTIVKTIFALDPQNSVDVVLATITLGANNVLDAHFVLLKLTLVDYVKIIVNELQRLVKSIDLDPAVTQRYVNERLFAHAENVKAIGL